MGRRDRQQNPIVHRSKLFGGRATAHELHAKLAWGGKPCSACGAPPAIRIQIFVALSDMSLALRLAVEAEIAAGRLHTMHSTAGPAVRTSVMMACSRCAPAAERAAANPSYAPSYAIVDIDRGPGEDKPVVGVILPGG